MSRCSWTNKNEAIMENGMRCGNEGKHTPGHREVGQCDGVEYQQFRQARKSRGNLARAENIEQGEITTPR